MDWSLDVVWWEKWGSAGKDNIRVLLLLLNFPTVLR